MSACKYAGLLQISTETENGRKSFESIWSIIVVGKKREITFSILTFYTNPRLYAGVFLSLFAIFPKVYT